MEPEQIEPNEAKPKNNPMCLIVIGMAGSGKTTFMQQLYKQSTLLSESEQKKKSFIINLDPAVGFVPYSPNIDIRKAIKYKELMKTHGLGPNGAIMTALNMYSARFNEVLEEIEKVKEENDLFIVDTPGQIEVFTWSASGTIIATTLANTLPTALVYIMDSQRCQNPNTFMSNMLFLCSIFYKMKLPLILVLNKCDAAPTENLLKWMREYETYMEEIQKEDNYLSSLSRSLCLVLDEFYQDLNVVSVSSLSGFGFDKFFESVKAASNEYKELYLPELKRMMENQEKQEKKRIDEELRKFKTDLKGLDLSKQKEENESKMNFFDKSKAQQFQITIDAPKGVNQPFKKEAKNQIKKKDDPMVVEK